MKLIFLMLFSFNLYAAEFIIERPCFETPTISTEFNPNQFETAGDITIHLLNKSGVSYLGNERGINQILNSPMGLDALDVESDTTMYAYGWCFSVNGEIINDFAEDIYLDESINNITWFFGYSKFYKDRWVSMCEHINSRSKDFICKN